MPSGTLDSLYMVRNRLMQDYFSSGRRCFLKAGGFEFDGISGTDSDEAYARQDPHSEPYSTAPQRRFKQNTLN